MPSKLSIQFPDSPVCDSTISRCLENQLITTKIAGKDNDVPFERNLPNAIEHRFEYATWFVNFVTIKTEVFISFDGVRSDLNIIVPPEFEGRFRVVMILPYNPFHYSVEQAHICFKNAVQQELSGLCKMNCAMRKTCVLQQA